MKLTTLLTASMTIFALSVAGEPLVPEVLPVAKARDSRLLRRDTASITFCTGTGFSGQCNTYQPTTDICYVSFPFCSQTIRSNNSFCLWQTVPDPYVDHLLSSRASSGFVCFLYRGGDCTGCEACVDADGWRDMSSVSVYFSVTYHAVFLTGLPSSLPPSTPSNALFLTRRGVLMRSVATTTELRLKDWECDPYSLILLCSCTSVNGFAPFVTCRSSSRVLFLTNLNELWSSSFSITRHSNIYEITLWTLKQVLEFSRRP